MLQVFTNCNLLQFTDGWCCCLTLVDNAHGLQIRNLVLGNIDFFVHFLQNAVFNFVDNVIIHGVARYDGGTLDVQFLRAYLIFYQYT